jgi:hypothetical protein
VVDLLLKPHLLEEVFIRRLDGVEVTELVVDIPADWPVQQMVEVDRLQHVILLLLFLLDSPFSLALNSLSMFVL